MKKKNISLVGFNILKVKKISVLLLLSYITVLGGCATSPESKVIACFKSQALDFRDNTPNQEAYPLFNIAYNNCSKEREENRKMNRLTMESDVLKDTNRKSLPYWAQKQIDEGMIKYDNTVKNIYFDFFNKIYKRD